MELLIKASAIIAIFYCTYKIFLQNETFFQTNRLYLLAGLIFATCLPFIVIPIYIEQTTIPVQNFIIADQSQITETSYIFNWLNLLATLYIIGLIVFSMRLIIQLLSLAFMLSKAKSIQKLGTYRIIKTNEDIAPFSFFNWIVYNPNQFNENEIDQILNHEKAHASQYHSIDMIITNIATVVFWFNPLVWFYKKDIEQNLEFIADKTAQHLSNCNKSYQYVLLKTSVPNYQLALANNFYNSLIKKRIVMLQKNKSQNRNLWKYIVVFPVLALFLMSFNTKEVYLEKEHANLIDSKKDIEVIVITKDFTDADFDKAKAEFKKLGVTLKFKGIKRNSDNEIIAINIEASSEKSKAKFAASNDEPISPIKIKFDIDNHSISIGSGNKHHKNGYAYKSKDGKHKYIVKSGEHDVHVYSNDDKHEKHEMHFITKDGKKHKVHKTGKGNNEVVFIKEGKDGKVITKEIIVEGDEDVEWTDDEGENIKVEIISSVENTWTNDEEEVYKIKKIKGDNMFFISSDEGSLIFIDGKESTKEDMKKLDTDKIDKVEVLKGDDAIKKYGKKAKAGVILITTK